MISPDQSLVYSALEHLKYKVIKHALETNDCVTMVVINGERVHTIDSTVAMVS